MSLLYESYYFSRVEIVHKNSLEVKQRGNQTALVLGFNVVLRSFWFASQDTTNSKYFEVQQ